MDKEDKSLNLLYSTYFRVIGSPKYGFGFEINPSMNIFF